MTAPPARNTLSGTPTNAQFNAGIGALYDYTVGLLGATGFRNLLINGNFQINQRGYVSGTNVGAENTYTLDRWRVVTSGQNVTFTASGNGNQITAPAGGIEQVIEGINIGGGTYVLNWTGTATATVNGTARAKGESFTLPANTNATVRLIGGTASQVQLEPGTVPTPFEHRPYGAELALCQRYFEKSFAQPTAPANGPNATSFVDTSPVSVFSQGNVINTNYRFAVTKRAAPTMTGFGNSSGQFAVASSGGAVTWTTVSGNITFGSSTDVGFHCYTPTATFQHISLHFTASAEL